MEKKNKQNGPLKTGQKKGSNHDKDSSQLNTYLKYSGLGFQMLVVIGVAVWVGLKLDELLNLQFPVFLISLAMIAVFASIFLLIKGLPKD